MFSFVPTENYKLPLGLQSPSSVNIQTTMAATKLTATQNSLVSAHTFWQRHCPQMGSLSCTPPPPPPSSPHSHPPPSLLFLSCSFSSRLIYILYFPLPKHTLAYSFSAPSNKHQVHYQAFNLVMFDSDSRKCGPWVGMSAFSLGQSFKMAKQSQRRLSNHP